LRIWHACDLQLHVGKETKTVKLFLKKITYYIDWNFN